MRRPWRWVAVAVAIAAVAPFWPSLSGEFLNWDDHTNFVRNPHFRGLGATQLAWMLRATLLGHYIPLTWLSLGLNYVLGGMDPRGYHLLNMLLHAANAALVFLIARRLLRAGWGERVSEELLAAGAAFTALLFAIHPLRAESVAWITERRDVLSGLFYLLAVLVYLRGVEGGGRLTGRWRAGVLALFCAGLLSKSIVMTLPLTLLLLDVYPLRRLHLGLRALLVEKAPYAVAAIAGAAISIMAVQHAGLLRSYGRYGLEARVALVGYGLWFYPAKTVWPAALSPLYELPPEVSLRQWRFLWPTLAVLVLTAALIALRRRWPAGLAAWAHFAIVLAPVSGVVHAGNQLAHDRYSYLSCLGFAVVGGAALVAAARRRAARPIAAVLAALLLAALAVRTWEQSAIWVTSERLWRAAVVAEPTCARCHGYLGMTLGSAGRLSEAEAALRQALALWPQGWTFHDRLGEVLAAQGRHAEAEAAFRRSIALAPAQPGAWRSLGRILDITGRSEEGAAAAREAARLTGRSAPPPEPR